MSFSEALARKIEARFRNLETSMVRYRRGTVTGTSPLQVDLGASGNSVDANALTTGLDVNDEVHALAWGNDLLVLGPSDGPTGGGAFVGQVTSHALSSAPALWLPCDGAAVSRSTYSDLFTAIGTTYGSGDGSTTFNVPNLKGRVPVGVDSGQTEFDTRGETGGAKTHTLTVGQIPAHTHSLLLGWGAGGNFRAQAGAALADFGTTGTIYNTLETNGSAPAGGNGQAHNNLQPYIALNYAIYAGA